MTETALKIAEKSVRACFTAIFDEIDELSKSLDLSRETLNKQADKTLIARYKRKVEKWEEDGILIGYFKYLVENTKTYTYYTLLTLLIYGIYYENLAKVQKTSKDLFDKVAKDAYRQVKEETNAKLHDPEDIMDEFLIVAGYNCTFDEYLMGLFDTFSEEAIVLIAMLYEINQSQLLEEKIMKQANRIILIKNDRYSGMLTHQARQLFNSLFVHLPVENAKIFFIAEMDERTTEMCRSLDGQVFNTNDMNEFDRYSDSAKGIVHYSVYGMVQGVNLPPIDDNFHWCRSTVTYNATE